MHRDEVPLGVEAVHLDEPVLVGRSTVDDDEGEVVVVVDLRPLAEMLRILDREGVEREHVAQDVEVLRSGLREVEPEELLPRQKPLDLAAVEVDLVAAALVNDVTDRLPRRGRPRGRALGSIVLHGAIVLRGSLGR